MTKKRKSKIILLFFVLVIAVVIFMFSAQNGEKSGNFSENFTENFLRFFHIENVSPGKAEHFLRKTAHFIEFFLLGAVVCLWISGYHKRAVFTGLLSFGLVFLYAVLDEAHQYWIPGRSASPKDVLLDASGALCGILLTMLCRYLCKLFIVKRRGNKVNMLYADEKELDKTEEL